MKYVLWIVVAALALFLFVVYQQQKELTDSQASLSAAVISGSQFIGSDIGGPFKLVHHNGYTVTDKNYADRFKLIYFGFTFCPAICPTELQKMTIAYENLPEDVAAMVKPLFISIDPERDTPEVVKEYMDFFHPAFDGLTGSKDQVKDAIDEYRVYAAKVQEEEMSDYTMDHSSFIYFMTPDNRPLDIFKMGDTHEEITRSVTEYVSRAIIHLPKPDRGT